MAANEESIKALAAHRAATQFGGEKANPHYSQIEGANRPGSIRQAVRHIARQEIDTENPNALRNCLPKKPTMAQYIALNILIKASKADVRAVEYATDQIDGKLAQPNVNLDIEALDHASDAELLELIEAGREAAERLVRLGSGEAGGQGVPGGEPAGGAAGNDPAPAAGAADSNGAGEVQLPLPQETL